MQDLLKAHWKEAVVRTSEKQGWEEMKSEFLFRSLKPVYIEWCLKIVPPVTTDDPYQVLAKKHMPAIFREWCLEKNITCIDVFMLGYGNNPEMPKSDSLFMQQYGKDIEKMIKSLEQCLAKLSFSIEAYLKWKFFYAIDNDSAPFAKKYPYLNAWQSTVYWFQVEASEYENVEAEVKKFAKKHFQAKSFMGFLRL